MENLIAKNEESALFHIESNYGKFTTDWYRQVGGDDEGINGIIYILFN